MSEDGENARGAGTGGVRLPVAVSCLLATILVPTTCGSLEARRGGQAVAGR